MIPTIQTRNLRLRAFAADDAPAYYEAILSDENAAKALPTGRPVPQKRVPAIIEGIADHWEAYGYGLWAVVHKANDKLLGHCGLQILGHTDYVELTIAVNPLDYAEEAAHAVLRYGFETLNLAEIVGVVLPGNTAVEKTYRSVGMRFWRRIHVFDQHLRAFHLRRELYLPKSNEPFSIGDGDGPVSD